MIIGLAGLARSGKNSVAQYLSDYHGFIQFAFAEPIKEMLNVIGIDARNEVTREYVDPRFGTSARIAAQTLGTEWGRECIDPDLWITVLKKRLHGYGYCKVVVTDVRFENEANWIRTVGTLWHIQRPEVGRKFAHVSESGIIPVAGDFALANDSTLRTLFDQVDAKIKNYG